MFDDPKKDLQRLQKQLLEAEDTGEEDASQVLEDVKRMLRREDWDDEAREPLYRRYVPEEEPEAPVPQETPAPKPRRGGLVTALVLESIALILMIVWWFLWGK